MQIKKILNKISKYLNNSEEITNIFDKILMQNGRAASNRNLNQKFSNINQAEFQIYSQWGEDGIIDYLIEKIERERNIPKKFIELGVENYIESNTRFLIKNRNWSGLIIDGSEDNIKFIKQDSIYWRHDLTALAKFITADNIDGLIAGSGFSGEIGLLSIDLDGNDYYIWDAIKSANPILVVCEYNSVFGDQHGLTIPYKPEFKRSNEHFSNLYFGASIKALIAMGYKKGYSFLGTSSNGVNAFFIRRDYFNIFERSFDEYPMFPSKFSESRNSIGQLSFLKGDARIKQISNMQVTEVDSNRTLSIGEIVNIYSSEWHHGCKSQHLNND